MPINTEFILLIQHFTAFPFSMHFSPPALIYLYPIHTGVTRGVFTGILPHQRTLHLLQEITGGPFCNAVSWINVSTICPCAYIGTLSLCQPNPLVLKVLWGQGYCEVNDIPHCRYQLTQYCKEAQEEQQQLMDQLLVTKEIVNLVAKTWGDRMGLPEFEDVCCEMCVVCVILAGHDHCDFSIIAAEPAAN